MSDETFLIAGLGNPGAAYANTRHNVGFAVIDTLARSQGLSLDAGKWDSLYCRVSLWGARLILVKPQTFMNLSGRPIARFCDFFKIPSSNLLVIHDDLDMHPGRVKLVATGGPGGHNGIRSIIQCLGTKDFFRLKYGIGRPGQNGIHPEIPVDRFVLSSFAEDEQEILDRRMAVIAEGVELFITSGAQQAMNILNVVK